MQQRKIREGHYERKLYHATAYHKLNKEVVSRHICTANEVLIMLDTLHMGIYFKVEVRLLDVKFKDTSL